jgi:hypothetical protein
MVPERELVGLLHGAGWTTLALSGTVTGAEGVVNAVFMAQSGEAPVRDSGTPAADGHPGT